jgi:hypothetical protein
MIKLVGKQKATVRKKMWQESFAKECKEIETLYKESFEEAVRGGILNPKQVTAR